MHGFNSLAPSNSSSATAIRFRIRVRLWAAAVKVKIHVRCTCAVKRLLARRPVAEARPDTRLVWAPFSENEFS